jgi:hypothetical protein
MPTPMFGLPQPLPTTEANPASMKIDIIDASIAALQAAMHWEIASTSCWRWPSSFCLSLVPSLRQRGSPRWYAEDACTLFFGQARQQGHATSAGERC